MKQKPAGDFCDKYFSDDYDTARHKCLFVLLYWWHNVPAVIFCWFHVKVRTRFLLDSDSKQFLLIFIFRERKSDILFKWIKIFFIDTFCHKHILQIEKAYQRESKDGRGGGGEGGGGDILSSSCCSNNSSKKMWSFAICKIFAAFDVLFLWKIIIFNLARTLQFEHHWGLTIWHPPPPNIYHHHCLHLHQDHKWLTRLAGKVVN